VRLKQVVVPYINLRTEVMSVVYLPSASFTLKMATARHSETWNQLQLMKWLNPENGSYALPTGRGNRLRSSVKKVLRSICETKTGEVIRGRRKLHNEELHDLYSSSDGHIQDEDTNGRNSTGAMDGKQEREDLEDLKADGRILL
jgi:hypothetical protein